MSNRESQFDLFGSLSITSVRKMISPVVGRNTVEVSNTQREMTGLLSLFLISSPLSSSLLPPLFQTIHSHWFITQTQQKLDWEYSRLVWTNFWLTDWWGILWRMSKSWTCLDMVLMEGWRINTYDTDYHCECRKWGFFLAEDVLRSFAEEDVWKQKKI